jgi:hypothetical protein
MFTEYPQLTKHSSIVFFQVRKWKPRELNIFLKVIASYACGTGSYYLMDFFSPTTFPKLFFPPSSGDGTHGLAHARQSL